MGPGFRACSNHVYDVLAKTRILIAVLRDTMNIISVMSIIIIVTTIRTPSLPCFIQHLLFRYSRHNLLPYPQKNRQRHLLQNRHPSDHRCHGDDVAGANPDMSRLQPALFLCRITRYNQTGVEQG